MTELDVHRLSASLVRYLQRQNPDGVKIMLAGLIDKIVLDPETKDREIHHRIDG